MRTDRGLVGRKAPSAFAVCVASAIAAWGVWCVLFVAVGEPFSSPPVCDFARVAIVLVPALAYLRSVWPCQDAMGLRYRWRRGVLVGVLVSVLVVTVLNCSYAFDLSFVPTDVNVWLNVIMLSPFAEELLFRRFAIDHLSKRYRPSIAVLISSLLIGALYLPWLVLSGDNHPVWIAAAIIGLLVAELTYGAIYRLTGSLWSCLLPHCVGSFASTLIV